MLEEKCSEMSIKIEELQREIQKLRPLQGTQNKLQLQFAELQEKAQNAACEARRFQFFYSIIIRRRTSRRDT